MDDGISLDGICGVRLYQRIDGYRFSIDSVLLSGFVRFTRGVRRVVDLGAGSGVVGLILARRSPSIEVTLVEVQEGLLSLARRNVEANRLRGRVSVVEADVSMLHRIRCKELPPGGFDMVVTNPPFRRPATGRVSPLDERAVARHEIRLTLEDALRASERLLKNRGRLFMVYHPFRLSELIHIMRELCLEPKRMRFVHPDRTSGATTVLIEAVKAGGVELEVERPLFIYRDEERSYTEEVLSLFRSGTL